MKKNKIKMSIVYAREFSAHDKYELEIKKNDVTCTRYDDFGAVLEKQSKKITQPAGSQDEIYKEIAIHCMLSPYYSTYEPSKVRLLMEQ